MCAASSRSVPASRLRKPPAVRVRDHPPGITALAGASLMLFALFGAKPGHAVKQFAADAGSAAPLNR
jgi:hypothetical protein